MVPFKLSVCGLSELESFIGGGVSHVLSIIDPEEPEPPAFYRFDPHHRLELRFHDVIEEDLPYSPPRQEHVERLLAFGAEMDRERAPTHLLVHCHMGVSRSTASMILLLAQARPERSGEEIMAEVARIRPQAWPNLRLVTMGDELLGRRGDLVSAVRGQYRRRAEGGGDELIHYLISSGERNRELEGLDLSRFKRG